MNTHKNIFIVCAFLFFIFPIVVFAQWAGPTQAPTGGNTAAPINVGSATQSKLGAFTVGSLGVTGGATVSGSVGIGTLVPQSTLQILGTLFVNSTSNATGGLYYGGASNGLIIGNYTTTPWPGTNGLNVNGSGVFGGSVTATAFYYSSDKFLKKNIQPLSGSLNKVLQLEGVSFDWKKDGTESMGVIAQDVEKVYPELVKTDEKTGLKSVEYGNLVAPLIEAIKEQQRQIDALKVEIEKLKK